MESLLSDLSRRGISLRVEDGRLRYTAPSGALSPELRALLRTRRPELIAALEKGPKLYPASFAQERFWRLQRLNPDESFYNARYDYRLHGPLDPALFRESLNAIARRHDSLRTSLREVDGRLMQAVAPTGEFRLTYVDSPPEELEQLLRTVCQRRFDLENEPGARALLVRTGPDRHVFQLCMHNTLYDRATLNNVLKELSVHYAALVGGQPAALPPPAQYWEYVRWQESLLVSGMEDRFTYWRNWTSDGGPPAWSWVPQEPAPAQPSFLARVTSQTWSATWTQRFESSCQSRGVTPYMAIIAALALTLRGYTGSADLNIGTTYSNRHDWRFDSLIGATIDVLALRLDLRDNPTFAILLDRVRNTLSSALRYQDVPADKFLPQQPGGPLRAVLSYFPETPGEGLPQLPGIRAEAVTRAINDVSRPDLYVFAREDRTADGKSLAACWLHKQTVFSAETATRMTGDFDERLSLALCY
jgi:hypothetical protein